MKKSFFPLGDYQSSWWIMGKGLQAYVQHVCAQVMSTGVERSTPTKLMTEKVLLLNKLAHVASYVLV